MVEQTKRPRGRPFKADGEKAITVGVSMPQPSYVLLRHLSKQTGVPISAMVREALRFYLTDPNNLRQLALEWRKKHG